MGVHVDSCENGKKFSPVCILSDQILIANLMIALSCCFVGFLKFTY